MGPAWRIYYRDGSTFDADDGTWTEAPAEGVIAVVVRHADSLRVHSGEDHYQLDGFEVVSHDTRTIIAHVGLHEMSPVKFGHEVARSKFEVLMRRLREAEGL